MSQSPNSTAMRAASIDLIRPKRLWIDLERFERRHVLDTIAHLAAKRAITDMLDIRLCEYRHHENILRYVLGLPMLTCHGVVSDPGHQPSYRERKALEAARGEI